MGPGAIVELKHQSSHYFGEGAIQVNYKKVVDRFAQKVTNPGVFKYNRIIPIMFGSLEGVYFSRSDNIRKFDGTEFLYITFDQQAVSEVQTLTYTNGTDTIGHFRLAFRGDITSDLTYASTAANIEAAMNALPSMIKANLTVVASGTAANTFTLTFSPGGPVTDQVTALVSNLQNASNVVESIATTVSTPGQRGFTNGTYYVDIYGLTWGQIKVIDGIVSWDSCMCSSGY